MAKLTLSDVSNLFGNPTSAANTINNNSQLVEQAFENTLSRDGTSPNQMNADLDLNHYDLINVDNITIHDITLDGQSLLGRLSDEAEARTAGDQANASAISTGLQAEAEIRQKTDIALHNEIISAISSAVIDKVIVVNPTIDSVQALSAFPQEVGGVLVNGTVSVGDGGAGQFSYLTGDYTTSVSADPFRGVVFGVPGVSPSVAIFKREYKNGVCASWFTDGIDGDYALAVNRAIAWATFTGERDVYIPAGSYDLKTSIVINEAGLRLHGAGSGSGGSSTSSVYKKGATKLNWIGGTDDSMISLNEGSTSIRWGIQVDNLDLYGNGVSNVDAINGNGYSAYATFRDITATGVRHGYTCDSSYDGSAYALTFDRVGFYHFTGYGWNLQAQNHNTKLISCRAWCDNMTPSGAVFIDGNPYGMTISACDFEPGFATYFVNIRYASGVVLSGNYFEARSTDTNAFVKLGENTVTPSGVFGISIIGNGFLANNFANYAVMLQQDSSGIDFSGNKITGAVVAVFNNNIAAAGQYNNYGANHLPSSVPLFSGPGTDSGWRKSTRTRLSADSSSITTDTGLLETTHYPRSPVAKRTIRATLYVQCTDTGSSSVNTRYFIQVSTDGGTTWNNFGAPARSGVGSISAGPLLETVVVEEVASNVLSPYTSIMYRVSVSPGTTDSIIVLAGSSLTVKEDDF